MNQDIIALLGIFNSHRILLENIRKYRDKVMLHSCGNMRKLTDIFIDAGFDCNSRYKLMRKWISECSQKSTMTACILGQVECGKAHHIYSGRGPRGHTVCHAVRHSQRRLHPESSHSIAYYVKYDTFMAMPYEHDKQKYSM